MRLSTHVMATAVLTLLAAASAAAQDRPAPVQDRQFMFSVSTLPADVRRVSVNLDSGFGERAVDVTDSDRPEQRFGIQAFLGHRMTFVGRLGVSSDQRDLRSSQQGELLYSMLRSPDTQGSVAVGLGMRHESAGSNVLLGRVAAGRAFSAWRVDGNALFEKPYSIGRDTVDLITTFGVSRRLLPAFYAGVELIGEDLEGFWEAEEAEGGARVLMGPSFRIAPPDKRWHVSVAGGPIVHATRSGRTSEATRGLPSSSSNMGYAARALFGYGF
jgi:hypothetical protein